MRLAPRLWIHGALIPALGMSLAFVLTGEIFRRSLHEAMDTALLAQASVETVSLFDGPYNEVHLHMENSPLLEQVRPFAPVASLYDGEGRRLLVFPDVETPPRVLPLEEIGNPILSNQGQVRELLVTVKQPVTDAVYTLRLAASREGISSNMGRYYSAAGAITCLFTLLLGLFQARVAGSLARRLGGLSAHMARMGHGTFDDPPPDRTGDEITGLRDGIARATRELEETRDARERLLADAAHELRTPLAAMRTSLDLALRRERSVGELKEALEDTREEVDRLAGLSSRLLDLAAMRAQPLATEPVDLGAVVEAALAAAKGVALARGVRLEARPLFLEVGGDPDGLRQILDNALDNAIKFSPVGGVVRVSLERRSGCVHLIVQDEGPGVPEAAREAVFAPFHRAALEVRGTGLGLALVREIAEKHGGRASFAPATRGARLVIELPSPRQGG